MLYTADASALKKLEKRMRVLQVMRDHGNDAIVPDQEDLDPYQRGATTWTGFRVNYQAKLTRPGAGELMERVSVDATEEDVVLVSDEGDSEHSYRRLLAEMIVNMFSGQRKLRYAGELK